MDDARAHDGIVLHAPIILAYDRAPKSGESSIIHDLLLKVNLKPLIYTVLLILLDFS